MLRHRVFGEPKPGVFYHTRKGAYLIACKAQKIALIRTQGGYFLPGGGLEAGETHSACILRECVEETGCRVRVGELLCSAEAYVRHERIGYFHPVQYYYMGSFLEQLCEPLESDHRLVWLACGEAADQMQVEQQGWAVRQALALLEKDWGAAL